VKAVILAGGYGSGLRLVTGGKPKVLLNICGKPFIERVITNLFRAGIKESLIITDKPHDFDELTARLGRVMSFELRRQVKPEVIGAILEAADELRRSSLLVYGDTLVPSDAYILTLSTSIDSGYPTILIVPNEDVRLYGAVKVSEDGFVTSFREKPKESVKGAYAFGGIGVFNDSFLEVLESTESLEDGINEYVRRGGRIRTALWSGVWVDLGFPVNTLEAMYYIMADEFKGAYISSKARVASTAVIEGPVYIDKGAIIDHYSVIRGPAYIGRDTLIGTHTFIRPYTDVESLATVGSYSELAWSLISERSTIGRGSFLGYSIVGEAATLEPGVTTKLLTLPEEEGIKAIKIVKRHRQYYKAGAVIAARSRVPALSTLEPGTGWSLKQ